MSLPRDKSAPPPVGQGLLGAEGLKHGLNEPQAPGTGPHSQGAPENTDLSKGVCGEDLLFLELAVLSFVWPQSAT